MMLKLVSTSFLRSANCSKVTTGRALSTTGLDYAISRGGALGERRLLVFVHGLFGNKLNFKSHAAKLSSQLGVDAVSVTLRNHRNSFRADSMTYVDMAVDLRNLIRDELKSESATVVGHSLGGKAVSLLALLSPEIVRGVIVVDIAPVIYPGSGNEHLKYAQAMRDADIAQAKSIGDVDQLLSDAVPDKTMRSFLLTNLRRGSNGEFEWAHNASIFAEVLVVVVLSDRQLTVDLSTAFGDGWFMWLARRRSARSPIRWSCFVCAWRQIQVRARQRLPRSRQGDVPQRTARHCARCWSLVSECAIAD
jgi:pimeloyl-ACP methyl ester carboxylesterase